MGFWCINFCNSICGYLYFVLVLVVVNWGFQSSDAFGTFGFNIHHRYSDRVKGILDLDGLPEKGSHQYYAAMAHRDRFFHGRRLVAGDSSALIFSTGNDTYRIGSLGYLYYANVSVGTPSLWFLVALDTGSDLFWLPCDCISCVHGLKTRSGQVLNFNIYSPNTSSTSMTVPCNSTMCQRRRQCSAAGNACPYQVKYLSEDTSSSGLLVEDMLHLTSDDSRSKVVDAQIKFGCGMIQTGSFLDGAAPNGLFGLGMQNISVPSILASKGLAANSFSMCFGSGIGRIRFGDKGSSDQGETPFNFHQLRPTYNISITQLSVGDNLTNLDFTAIFDSGTSFTYVNDPAYSIITGSFNSQAQEKRHRTGSGIPFEYCYDLSGNETTVPAVNLTLTMKGGNPFYVTDPLVIASLQGGGFIYCLGVVKSEDVNIIGQNFMTGYNIVFDLEKMVLGWKASNCYNAEESDTLPITPRNSTAPPPTVSMQPEATSRLSPLPGTAAPPPNSHSHRSSSFTCTLVMVIFSISSHYIFIVSS